MTSAENLEISEKYKNKDHSQSYIPIAIVSISVYSRLDFFLQIFTYIDKYSAKPCPTLAIP